MIGEHELYPIVTESEGCFELYSSVTEFKEYLSGKRFLSSERSGDGCVFWMSEREYDEYEVGNTTSDNVYGRSIREKIRRVLIEVMPRCHSRELVQFWAPKEVGDRSILTTLHQPFAVSCEPDKGLSWHRKKCIYHHYIVDDGAKEEQLGPPGRVLRNGLPESSPDLRLYSAKQFPLRDHAASCKLTSYLALPVFDLYHNQCVGVLEFVGKRSAAADYLVNYILAICDALKVAHMRTTHTIDAQQIKNLWESAHFTDHGHFMYRLEQRIEIREMLELAVKAVPQLFHAQVRVHLERHANNSNNFNSMEVVASLIKYPHYFKDPLHEFLDACAIHNLQNGVGIGGLALSSTNKSSFCQNISDFSIYEYPLAHYAQQARLSFCFAVCLRNIMHSGNNNGLYIFEFFLQPQSRDHAYIWFVLCLLLKIMENTLRGFTIATGRQLAEKLVVDEVRRKYLSTSLKLGQNSMLPFGFEVIRYGLEHVHQQQNIHCLVPMEGYDGGYSISEFREYLQKTDLHWLQTEEIECGFICHMKGKELLEKRGNSYSMLQLDPSQEKIKFLMSKIISIEDPETNFLIQLWAPKIIENRSYLSTSDQPFALGYLGKGLCLYRKRCMEHFYYVGNGAKQEELGPPGRVFLTGHPESSPDLCLYSISDFPLLMHVVHCNARKYLALPLFDLQQKYCLGILECVGFPYNLEYILEKLKEADLRSTHLNSNFSSINIDDGRKLVLAEIKEMFKLLEESPELWQAFAWTPCSQCANMNIEMFCMERVCDMRVAHFNQWKFHEVNIRKGVVGRVLELENKMCFFENIGDFSVLEQPWAHYAQAMRSEFCFVICLQSSHTGNDLYVLEFFICPGGSRDGYPWSYLSFLLSTMQRNLKSFKVSSGQQLGEHLLCQAIRSGKVDQLQFKTIKYNHEIDHTKNVDEQEQSIIDTNSKERNKRGEGKTSFRISYGDLEPHFGKRLEVAANDLGVSRSALKRASKECGIKRWPSNVKNKKNPSLFQIKTSHKPGQNSDQQISKSSSSSLPISYFLINSNLPHSHTCNDSTREFDKTYQEANVVTIKAKFKEDIIKFDLCLSLGMETLVEEVAKRLNLMIGNFKLKYNDDDDLILLTCDEDLHHYVRKMRSLGKIHAELLVYLVYN